VAGRGASVEAEPVAGTEGRGPAADPMRLLVRHQWVREHDVPRITVLAGPLREARALWNEWLALTNRVGRPPLSPPSRAGDGWLERSVRHAIEAAAATPREPVALAAEPAVLGAWLAARDDRLAAVVNEGLIILPGGHRRATGPAAARSSGKALFARKARSLAELTLFEALEATPATAGRFELNGLLSVAFGGRAAEIDLLSRQDEIAIEVDGFHHFTDPAGYRRDRRKEVVLQGHGYAVLRFLATDILDDTGAAAVRAVVELIGQRRRLRRKRP
jgi:very-short-patch-repair endonuclease